MKRILLASTLALAACSNPQTVEPPIGHILDAGTTYYGLSQGLSEANPILSACGGPLEIAACSVLVKVGFEEYLVSRGHDRAEVRHRINKMGTGVGVYNLALISGVALPAAIALGYTSAVVYEQVTRGEGDENR